VEEEAVEEAYDGEDEEANHAAVRLQAAQRGRMARSRVKGMEGTRSAPAPQEEEEVAEEGLDYANDNDLSVQAAQRGRVARSRVKGMPSASAPTKKEEEEEEDEKEEGEEEKEEEEEEEKEKTFDYADDEETQRAAVKMQAAQRGRMARNRVKGMHADLAPASEGEVEEEQVGVDDDDEAGGSMRAITQPTLNLRLLLRASVSAFTLKVNHAPISARLLVSMTLLREGAACGGDVAGCAARSVGPQQGGVQASGRAARCPAAPRANSLCRFTNEHRYTFGQSVGSYLRANIFCRSLFNSTNGLFLKPPKLIPRLSWKSKLSEHGNWCGTLAGGEGAR